MDAITDNTPFGKYFSFMLHIEDDDLDAYQYRLLGHYKRVCGMGGICFESTKTTAERCKMSTGKVSAVRWQLVELGYINIFEADGTDAIVITLIDRMEDNIARYSDTRSPHEQWRSPHERTRSPHELEESTTKKQPYKKPIAPANADATRTTDTKPVKAKAERKPNPLFDAVALHLFGIPLGATITQGARIGKVVSVCKAHDVAADDLPVFAAWYKREYKDAALPRDAGKIEEHLTRWQSQRKGTSSANGWYPPEFTGKRQ